MDINGTVALGRVCSVQFFQPYGFEEEEKTPSWHKQVCVDLLIQNYLFSFLHSLKLLPGFAWPWGHGRVIVGPDVL